MLLLIMVLFGSWALVGTAFCMAGVPTAISAILGIIGPALVVCWALKSDKRDNK